MYYYLALAVIGYYGYNKYKRDVDMLIIGGTFQLVKIYHVIKDYCGVDTEEKKEEIVEEVRKYLYIKDGEIEEMNKNDSPKKEELDFLQLFVKSNTLYRRLQLTRSQEWRKQSF